MDPQPPAGGGPPANPADALTQLAEAMAVLANVSSLNLANNLLKAKVVQKPSSYKGETTDDTCRFLMAFEMWGAV